MITFLPDTVNLPLRHWLTVLRPFCFHVKRKFFIIYCMVGTTGLYSSLGDRKRKKLNTDTCVERSNIGCSWLLVHFGWVAVEGLLRRRKRNSEWRTGVSCAKTEVKSIASRGNSQFKDPNMGQTWMFSGKRRKTRRPGQCGVRSGQMYAGLDHMRFRPPSPGKGRNFAPSMMEIFGGSQENDIIWCVYVFCF